MTQLFHSNLSKEGWVNAGGVASATLEATLPLSPSTYETTLIQFFKEFKTQVVKQWQTWSEFHVWFNQIEQLYSQGMDYPEAEFSVVARAQLKQVSLLYQQLSLYASCQDLITSLREFVQYFSLPRTLTWNDFQSCADSYQPVVDLLECLSHHWVREFESLCQRFLHLYQQLPYTLDWSSYEALVNELTYPSTYLSHHIYS